MVGVCVGEGEKRPRSQSQHIRTFLPFEIISHFRKKYGQVVTIPWLGKCAHRFVIQDSHSVFIFMFRSIYYAAVIDEILIKAVKRSAISYSEH